jgi:enoyl-CoA hydratase/carnithine racemase
MSADFIGKALSFNIDPDRIAQVTLTRPSELNTISLDFMEEMSRALDAAQSAKARAFIIAGSGRAFCCGAHLDYFTDPKSPVGRSPVALRDNYVGPICRLFDRLEAMPFPTIAAINGFALGGGCELALACDLRLMAATAKIGLPEVKIGVLPAGGGVQKLARFVGRAKALEIILTGKHMSAEEANSLGLLYGVSEPDALIGDALALARLLARNSPLAMAQAKASVYRCESIDLKSAREFGLETCAVLFGSPEFAEGVSAFKEKREPRFT